MLLHNTYFRTSDKEKTIAVSKNSDFRKGQLYRFNETPRHADAWAARYLADTGGGFRVPRKTTKKTASSFRKTTQNRFSFWWRGWFG
jgi:hypothetical protein